MQENKKYCYDYPRPAVASDIILLCGKKEDLKILLIKRKNEPFSGRYALPGGFVDPDETCKQAAYRELKEETSVSIEHLHEFGVYSEPERDPRGRMISVVYWAYLPELDYFQAGDDAAEVQFFKLNNLPPLAFDHTQVMSDFLASRSFSEL